MPGQLWGDSGNVCFTSGALPRLAERAEDHVWACLCLPLPLLQHHALSWHRHGVTQAFPPISQSFQSFIQKQTPVFETQAKKPRFCPWHNTKADSCVSDKSLTWLNCLAVSIVRHGIEKGLSEPEWVQVVSESGKLVELCILLVLARGRRDCSRSSPDGWCNNSQQSNVLCVLIHIRNRYLHTEDSIDLDFVWILKILGARQMPEQHCQIDFEYKM